MMIKWTRKDYFLVRVLLVGLLLTIIDSLLEGLLPTVIGVCLHCFVSKGYFLVRDFVGKGYFLTKAYC